jgi:predicted flap endonuclease-1-like 5' DNA nuclease
MKLPKFLLGLIIGGLFAVIFWYWQKSTSAEDGALSVLDRLAASEARVRDLEADLHRPPRPAAPPVAEAAPPEVVAREETADNLQDIDGIGPTYARRLQEAGINTFADLAQQTPEHLLEVCGARSLSAVESWIVAARVRARG